MVAATVAMWTATAVFWVDAPKTTSGILRLTGQSVIVMDSICECVGALQVHLQRVITPTTLLPPMGKSCQLPQP